LAIEGNDIFVSPTIHHLNPISIEDVVDDALIIWDPENVICVSPNTHNAIHYGDEKTLVQLPTERRKGDTNLW
jgi:predicted HNH restriction endonuclease